MPLISYENANNWNRINRHQRTRMTYLYTSKWSVDVCVRERDRERESGSHLVSPLRWNAAWLEHTWKPSPNTPLFIWLIKGLSGILESIALTHSRWALQFILSKNLFILFGSTNAHTHRERMCVVRFARKSRSNNENMWMSLCVASKIYVSHVKTYQT